MFRRCLDDDMGVGKKSCQGCELPGAVLGAAGQEAAGAGDVRPHNNNTPSATNNNNNNSSGASSVASSTASSYDVPPGEEDSRSNMDLEQRAASPKKHAVKVRYGATLPRS